MTRLVSKVSAWRIRILILEVGLVVEAGFTCVEAIKITTFNGAKALGEDAHIDLIAVGKQADLMIVIETRYRTSAK